MEYIYKAHVQFNAIEVTVKAKTEAEAKRKVIEKLKKKKVVPLIDKGNFFIDEFDAVI